MFTTVPPASLPASAAPVASRSTADPAGVLRVVAGAYGLTPDALTRYTRDASTVEARRVAMYLLRYDCGLTYMAIAQRLQRDHSTVMSGVAEIAGRVAAGGARPRLHAGRHP